MYLQIGGNMKLMTKEIEKKLKEAGHLPNITLIEAM